MAYPLFDAPLTTLSEASKLTEVIEEVGIDVIHAHYAVPHATAAVLARDMVRGGHRPAVVTTLHGTDVTLVGLDRAYLRTTQYSIERSDVVTAVSRFLADDTVERLGVRRSDIRVVPNAVDLKRFTPGGDPELRLRYAHPDERLVAHVSNFRPVKRVEDVIRVFAGLSAQVGARLLMIGDGPDRPHAMALAAELGVEGRVSFLGSFPRVERLLAVSDLFVLPSDRESFGLAALEAMAGGVPVIGTSIGGLPEVVEDGVTGALHPLGDVAAMVASAVGLLTDAERYRNVSQAARDRAERRFSEDGWYPRSFAPTRTRWRQGAGRVRRRRPTGRRPGRCR
jgi:N-acetyl-alpha-D-glucosaminyl L-malate synthase BshA